MELVEMVKMHFIKSIYFSVLDVLKIGRNKRKIFCIGLHKTGTTSLSKLADKQGLKSTHTVDWANRPAVLAEYDFFCDGGSHFDHINEFPFEDLYHKYPNALFILQSRDDKKWVISKCKHAGWNKDTRVEADEPGKITHNDWKYKSYLTVRKFIEHKRNYENRVKQFFQQHDPSRLLTVDMTDTSIQAVEISRLLDYLGFEQDPDLKFPHSNKAKNDEGVSPELIAFIDSVINETK